jgi:hypothetical protein
MSGDSVRCLPIDGKVLVFGMDWLPLLGSDARQQALAKARRHQASHFVLASEHAAAMGLVQLSTTAETHSGLPYSAAQVMAALHPVGTVVAVIGISPALWWLVAIHEGAVVARTDLWFSDPAQAAPIVAEVCAAYPQSRCLEDTADASGLPGLDALSRAADSKARLQRVHDVRRWIRRAGLLAVLALSAGIGFAGKLPAFFAQTNAKAPALSSAQQLQAWERVRHAMAEGIPVHGVSGMHVVLQSLYRVPVVLAGWQLGQADCRSQGMAWRCIASYRRVDRHADNHGLMGLAPKNWLLRFPAVDRVEAEWEISSAAIRLSDSRVDEALHSQRHWLSSLQQISAAFVALKATDASAVPLQAPSDEQGNVLPKPDNFRLYQRRQLQAEGPLRSFSLLLPNLTGVRWHRLTLTLKVLEHPNLTQSRLNLSAQGERYEWQS